MKRKKIKVYDYCIERAKELNNQGRKNTSTKYRGYGVTFKQNLGFMALHLFYNTSKNIDRQVIRYVLLK